MPLPKVAPNQTDSTVGDYSMCDKAWHVGGLKKEQLVRKGKGGSN